MLLALWSEPQSLAPARQQGKEHRTNRHGSKRSTQ